MHWDDPDRLAADLAALPPLDNETVEASEAEWLIDAVHPGAPLLISFSYVTWTRKPPFYLFGRSKKLEGITGRPMNRILLRDRSFHWFLHGVSGLGAHVDDVVARLRLLIAAIGPSEVWCIGDSMGGYAAAMFGFLLHADRIVAISPLSHFDANQARLYHEKRFLWAQDSIAAAPPASGYYDLPQLARETGYRGKLHLVVGTTGGVNLSGTVNVDLMHAYRFGNVPGLKMHYVPEADHDYVALLLYRSGRIDGLLLECLFDHPPALEGAAQLDRFTPRLPASAAPAEKPARKRSRKAEPAGLRYSFAPLDSHAVAAAQVSDRGFIVDSVKADAPLLICFGDSPSDQAATFDFFETSEKLAALCDRPLNRILLRDLQRQWYLRGVPGLGDDCHAVARGLRQFIDDVRPERVICLGNGMGGYAAILFAILLGADQAIALNPLSLLDGEFAQLCHDPRHAQALAALDAAPAANGPRDLLQLTAETGYWARLDILFGSMPPVASWHAGCHGAVHAARLGLLPNVRLHPWHEVKDGELLWWLENRKVLAPLLRRIAFGEAF